jgi:hypothetical protein
LFHKKTKDENGLQIGRTLSKQEFIIYKQLNKDYLKPCIQIVPVRDSTGFHRHVIPQVSH